MAERRNPVRDDLFKALRVQEAQRARWEIIELPDAVVHVLVLPDEYGALLQEGRWEELGNRHKVRFDRAHYGDGKDHYHVAKVNSRNDLFAINADGTGSHGSTGMKISNDVAVELKRKYGDDIRIPPGNIIELLDDAAAQGLFEAS